MSKIMEMTAGTLAQPPLVFPTKARMIGGAEKKATKQSHREIPNMRSDEDLSQNRPEPAWETNPRSRERRVIGSGSDANVMTRKIRFGGID
jgi:hypothetical protein